MGNSIYLNSDGGFIEVKPKGEKFTLAELQQLVGGNIQIVYMEDDDNRVMVVNEDGLIKRLPFNESASWLLGMYVGERGRNNPALIRGNVLIVDKDKID